MIPPRPISSMRYIKVWFTAKTKHNTGDITERKGGAAQRKKGCIINRK
jgi:hypothetical protein